MRSIAEAQFRFIPHERYRVPAMKWHYQRPSGRIVAEYLYRDQHGRELFRVRRHDPKGFTVRRASGKWLRPHERYRKIPYRLPELMAADPNQTVYVVEGEKDVDTLWSAGLPATCNAFGGGRGKWTRGYSRWLRGRQVVILPDNDRTGQEHGLWVAKALYRVAASVRVVDLPRLPHKGDVSDWLGAWNTVEGLVTICSSAPLWRPGKGGGTLPDPDLYERYKQEVEEFKECRRKRGKVYGLPVAPTEKLLLMMIADFCDTGQSALALYLGVTERRVRQMIRSLVERKIISKWKSGRKNRYRVNV
ncbi:MAG TPA: hypothetical protein VHI52_19025 [Verrucomicrobiae bacterium]|jgi:hypothetical protein|nr:hypothetical protein [Verrucomicrobiae bacterium]